MSDAVSWKSASRTDWHSTPEAHSPKTFPGREAVRLGALLRIADASEAMAKRHTDLIEENESLRRRNNSLLSAQVTFERRVAALKGHIGRLKRTIEAMK